MFKEGCEHYGPLHVQQERPQMRVVFKSYSRPTLQAAKHGFFHCPTKPSTQARSTLEWRSCRSLPGGHASVIHAARLYRWQITLLLSSPFSHSNLLLPQIHIPLYIIHNFQGLVFFQVLVRFPVTIQCSPHKKWRREKLASQSTCSEKFHTYISLECLYVARLRNITLPLGLGIHDNANQTSGGRTPSFSVFTS